MGTGQAHIAEEGRPQPDKTVLPRTSPRTLQDALQKEIETAEHIVELWWASRPVHDDASDPRVARRFQELRDQARSIDRPAPYTEALRFTLCTLGDGHLRLVDDPAETTEYFSGLHFARADDKIIVSKRSVGAGKGGQAKPLPGDALVAVDGTPVAEWLDRLCLVPGSTAQHRQTLALASLRHQSRYAHEQPTPRALTLQRASGETYGIDLDWTALRPGAPVPCVGAKMIDSKAKIGLLEVRTMWCRDPAGNTSDARFMTQLATAAKTLKKAKHVVVDLRGNPGGSEWAGKRALGMLRGGRSTWTRERTRHPYAATSEIVDVYHQPAPGDPTLTGKRLSVLVDAGCADSCELLAGALSSAEGVTVYGRTTAGSVGRTVAFRLPYTGLLLSVPVTEHFVGRDDAPIEGRGIVPDVKVVRARSDVRVGVDADLEVALERIRN